jgi:hypothetical protein
LYACAGIRWHDREGALQPLAVDGRLVLFDTATVCRSFIPRLGPGRFPMWTPDRETLFFSPIDTEGFNAVVILTGYDPYDVPAGFRRMGIWSEGKGRDWRYHCQYGHVYKALMAWADKLEQDRQRRDELRDLGLALNFQRTRDKGNLVVK